MWHSYTRHNVQKPRLLITKSHDEVPLFYFHCKHHNCSCTRKQSLVLWSGIAIIYERKIDYVLSISQSELAHIAHRSKHEKIIMHQPSWSYASSITQPSWRWSYQNGKSYARWLHHTPINIRKDYHASTFMIIRIKHNPTILALEISTWIELHKMVTSHNGQYTKRISCINPHDHTHQA